MNNWLRILKFYNIFDQKLCFTNFWKGNNNSKSPSEI